MHLDLQLIHLLLAQALSEMVSMDRSYGGINPPHSLNIIEAVLDHLDSERNKMQPTSKEEFLGCTSRSLENYSVSQKKRHEYEKNKQKKKNICKSHWTISRIYLENYFTKIIKDLLFNELTETVELGLDVCWQFLTHRCPFSDREAFSSHETVTPRNSA